LSATGMRVGIENKCRKKQKKAKKSKKMVDKF